MLKQNFLQMFGAANEETTNSAVPAFWDQRYASGKTPWVLQKIPASLRSFLRRTRTQGSVLIPGCGTDHGVIKAFADAGFEVTGIDFSQVAIAETKKALGNLGRRCEPDTHRTVRIIRGDFFKSDFARRFDFVYERTFLCSMHPRRWARYAKRVAELLRPGGRLIGIFFYGTEADPPPYPINKTQAAEIFAKYFHLARDLKVSDSVPMFTGMERWQEWERMTMK